MYRNIFLAVVLFSITRLVFSQAVIHNPIYGKTNVPFVIPVMIEITDSSTIISFHTTFSPGDWISIDAKTYIQPVNSKTKYYLISASGIPINKRYTIPPLGEVEFKLVFPKLDVNKVSKFHFIEEAEANKGWSISDIELKSR